LGPKEQSRFQSSDRRFGSVIKSSREKAGFHFQAIKPYFKLQGGREILKTGPAQHIEFPGRRYKMRSKKGSKP